MRKREREIERKKKRKRKSMIAERVTNADPSNREKIGEKLYSNGKENKKKWSNFFPSLLGKSATCLSLSLSFAKEKETNFNNFSLYTRKINENIFAIQINESMFNHYLSFRMR